MRIWGFGLRTSMSTGITGAPVTHYATAVDGSFTLTRGRSALAVDFSRAGGADAVVIAVGPGAGRGEGAPSSKGGKATTQITQTKLGDTPVSVLTLQTGEAPKVSTDGDAVVVGGQRYRWDGHVLAPATFNATKP